MSKSALILIDIQNIYFTKGPYLLNKPEEAAGKAKKILDYFRSKNLPVIHVQHDFNTANYEESYEYLNKISSIVEPLPEEKIVYKKFPNSFFETDLLSYLKSNNIENLVVAGMMSHMCIDTTVRACKDYGYKVTVIDDACTTKDLEFRGLKVPAEYVHITFMAGLKNMFATLMSSEEFLTSND